MIRRNRSSFFSFGFSAALWVSALALGGCSGSQSPTPVTLTSIAVTPANANLALGNNQAFTATGMFSDGTMKDLTLRARFYRTYHFCSQAALCVHRQCRRRHHQYVHGGCRHRPAPLLWLSPRGPTTEIATPAPQRQIHLCRERGNQLRLGLQRRQRRPLARDRRVSVLDLGTFHRS